VRARLTREEQAIRILEAKVAELEAWRPDLEKRIQDRTEKVDTLHTETHEKIDKNKQNFEQHLYYIKKDQKEKSAHIEKIDLMIENNKTDRQ